MTAEKLVDKLNKKGKIEICKSTIVLVAIMIDSKYPKMSYSVKHKKEVVIITKLK